MYGIGEHVIYGTNGICRVGKVCRSPFDPSDSRLFYVLYPLFDLSNSVIYTPVDNPAVVMRPPVSKKEAEDLFGMIPELDIITVPEEKKRKDCCRWWIWSRSFPKGFRISFREASCSGW